MVLNYQISGFLTFMYLIISILPDSCKNFPFIEIVSCFNVSFFFSFVFRHCFFGFLASSHYLTVTKRQYYTKVDLRINIFVWSYSTLCFIIVVFFQISFIRSQVIVISTFLEQIYKQCFFACNSLRQGKSVLYILSTITKC